MSVRPQEYFTYRGKVGQWSWILHRLTGLGVFVFLLLHILDTAAIGWGPNAYNAMAALYRAPVFRVGEVLLAGAVLYHALNGLRICVMDFWPSTMRLEKKLAYGVAGIFVAVYLPCAIYMMRWAVR
jgi:succinate dehydrogenase / fumarate reductase, cytochrome b subunit